MELEQTIPHAEPGPLGTNIQGLLVSGSELGEVVCRVRYRLLNLIDPPGVVRNVLLVLGVDGIHLPVCGRLGEERAYKELRESVQRSTEMVWTDVKIVVGVVAAGESIETSAMLTQELAVLVLIRKLFGP